MLLFVCCVFINGNDNGNVRCCVGEYVLGWSPCCPYILTLCLTLSARDALILYTKSWTVLALKGT